MLSPLDIERRKSQISSRELAYFLHQSKSNVEKLERLEKLLVQDPLLNHEKMYYMTRGEQYKRATQMARQAVLIAHRNNLDDQDTALLHLVLQGFTDEQQSRWMEMAKQWRMVGCYVQTELGHGSNVRGLETTASYIPADDEFEIHSPTVTSMKWWPGALARTANFGVVYARLLLGGKDYGVHNFMVQLRDLETHDVMPGVTLGDIGPKIGFNNVDNGYCAFNRVRIPRSNMGMRFATVTSEGKYTKNVGIPKEVIYFTMLQTRMVYVRSSGLALAKACTISIRYSGVRRQGYDARNPESTEEVCVLDYQTQQYRLFPLLAAAYAIILSGNHVDTIASQLADQVKNGDLSMLVEGHTISCGLKVVASEMASNGIETCRRACGGHGYLLSSGLPVLLGDVVQMVTAEGENFVLCQQTARALLKIHGQYQSGGQLPTAMQFIAQIDTLCRSQPRSKDQWLELDTVAEQFAVRAAPSEIRLVLQLLCKLFALTQLDATASQFIESGCIFSSDMTTIRASMVELLDLIRPHAVTLVDGFNFSDHALNSTLGRYDGNVYEALYKSAQHDPFNPSSDKVALHELLRPIREEIACRSTVKSRL
ncbi:peroxisomal acyl-coenzyme a [Plasmopara halstedii]|uniref:Acyl-coenzyme A oxidase n=1 Tax=Plasmopara halstedii TaxID=4781 RepID=A0A0N7L3Q2_PLAHL|nr:peroxisomal acyl-coenzyme a [Plasmopara halstedii]CEG36507.1 peroxisomal acyl-coenzyme a [Plasmopara halstedii]|eukprot:XP_024572876.1 peroxisomal acyl-coenzyme a [Plasmopara halstedii]